MTSDHKVPSELRRLLDTSPDAVVLVNRAGVIVALNGRAEALFGASAQKLRERAPAAPRDSPTQISCRRRAAWSSPLLTTLSSSRSNLERTAGS